MFVAFVLFGLSVIPFTYLLSFLFRSHSTAQNIMILLYLVRGHAHLRATRVCTGGRAQIGGVLLLILSFAFYFISATKNINNSVIRSARAHARRCAHLDRRSPVLARAAAICSAWCRTSAWATPFSGCPSARSPASSSACALASARALRPCRRLTSALPAPARRAAMGQRRVGL